MSRHVDLNVCDNRSKNATGRDFIVLLCRLYDHMKLLCFVFQGCFMFFTALFSYFCVLCSRLTCFVLYWLHCLCPVLDACVTPHCIVCAISYRVNVCVASS